MYETFEHTADLGLRASAPDLPTLFAEAARGLFSILVANLDAVRPVQTERFALQAERLDDLFFDWLSELLYRFETRRMLFSEFKVEIAAGDLRAEARGEPADEARHRLEHEIKAITYHGLKCESGPQGWLAEAIVDI